MGLSKRREAYIYQSLMRVCVLLGYSPQPTSNYYQSLGSWKIQVLKQTVELHHVPLQGQDMLEVVWEDGSRYSWDLSPDVDSPINIARHIFSQCMALNAQHRHAELRALASRIETCRNMY